MSSESFSFSCLLLDRDRVASRESGILMLLFESSPQEQERANDSRDETRSREAESSPCFCLLSLFRREIRERRESFFSFSEKEARFSFSSFNRTLSIVLGGWIRATLTRPGPAHLCFFFII